MHLSYETVRNRAFVAHLTDKMVPGEIYSLPLTLVQAQGSSVVQRLADAQRPPVGAAARSSRLDEALAAVLHEVDVATVQGAARPGATIGSEHIFSNCFLRVLQD